MRLQFWILLLCSLAFVGGYELREKLYPPPAPGGRPASYRGEAAGISGSAPAGGSQASEASRAEQDLKAREVRELEERLAQSEARLAELDRQLAADEPGAAPSVEPASVPTDSLDAALGELSSLTQLKSRQEEQLKQEAMAESAAARQRQLADQELVGALREQLVAEQRATERLRAQVRDLELLNFDTDALRVMRPRLRDQEARTQRLATAIREFQAQSETREAAEREGRAWSRAAGRAAVAAGLDSLIAQARQRVTALEKSAEEGQARQQAGQAAADDLREAYLAAKRERDDLSGRLDRSRAGLSKEGK